MVGRDGIKLSSGDSADWNFKLRVSGESLLKAGPLGCRSLDSEWVWGVCTPWRTIRWTIKIPGETDMMPVLKEASVNTGSQGGGEDERGRGTSLRDVSAVSTVF